MYMYSDYYQYNYCLKDEDIRPLHGKGIKRRRLIPPSDCNARDMCSVLVWEMIVANRYENRAIFLENLGGHQPQRRIVVRTQELITTSMS